MSSGLTQLAAAAERFFLEPDGVQAGPAPPPDYPTLAVVGMGPGCGATTVARGLAGELRRRLAAEPLVAGPGALPNTGPHDGPLVWDAGTGDAERLGRAGAGLDAAVLVAPGGCDPALVALAGELLEQRLGRPPAVVWNGAGDAPDGALVVPRSRLSTRRGRAGRAAGGRFGRAMATLADACLGEP